MLSKKDVNFLNLARLIADFSEERKKHGAVVIKSGRVVGTGFNKFKNHPLSVSPDHIKTHCSRHAEQEAIKQAGKHTKGATLYVARINKQGLDRNSKPCSLCTELINNSGIKRVIYTTEQICH